MWLGSTTTVWPFFKDIAHRFIQRSDLEAHEILMFPVLENTSGTGSLPIFYRDSNPPAGVSSLVPGREMTDFENLQTAFGPNVYKS